MMTSCHNLRRMTIVAICTFALLILVMITRLYNTNNGLEYMGYGVDQSPGLKKQQVHLLIPGNQANSRICRTLMSAIVNGYPPPVIINWGLKDGDPSMNGYDMTTGKNWGVLRYLRALPQAADNDIVIMVDAHDVVFQLPLDIVLQRYSASRDQAAIRLIDQHGAEQVQLHGLATTIIMGAEKFCWPLDHKHPACWAVPSSPLRDDMFGRRTDKETDLNRPRWLNSGTVIGPVGDLRKLYERAHLLWTVYDTWGGDQDYFSNIYGRQELSRQVLRGSKEWVFGFGEDFEEKDLIWPHMEVQHTDYHLGVDMTSTLFQTLHRALDDLSSVVHSNTTDVEAKDRQHNTAEVYNASFPFPDDLLTSPMPLEILSNYTKDSTWRDVRLFSNFRARSIPAILHYNGDKTRIDDWWQRQWWTGQGRELARLRMSDEGFSINTDSNASRILRWEDMCGKFQDELFVSSVETYE